MKNTITKNPGATFTQTVGAKLREGETHYGVHFRQNFYPIHGTKVGDSVTLRSEGSNLELHWKNSWQRLSYFFPV